MRLPALAATATWLCCLALLTGCSGGGGGGGPGGPRKAGGGTSASAPPPTASILAKSGATPGDSATALKASVGSTIVLASASTAGAGATISSYAWTLVSTPDGSQVSLGAGNTSTVSFVPDTAGDYTLRLDVMDSQSQHASQTVTIAVTSAPPTAVIVTKVAFDNSATVRPSQTVPLGAIITLDATGVSTSDSNPVAIDWMLTAAPANSAASLATNGASAHFTPDVSGEYRVQVRALHAAGDFVEATYVFEAVSPPAAVVVAQTSLAADSTLSAYTTYAIVLDGSSSTGPAGDTLSKTWTLDGLPDGSTATLAYASGNITSFVADKAGTYIVTLHVTDSTAGVTSTHTVTINVVDGPTAVVTGSVSPVPAISALTFVSSPGAPVTLRGGGSYVPGGGTLSYLWTLVSRPAASTASIASPTAQNITFTPDVVGAYALKLTVTDGQDNSSSQTATVNVGAYAPVAVVDQPLASTLLGSSVHVSAALSYDPNSLPLTYSWAVDSAPAGSTAAVDSPYAADTTFTPDVAGTYTLTVTVNNGTLTSVASTAITAFTATSGTVPLSYVPLKAAYSATSDKAVIVSTNPNTLHIVDPNAATDVSVPLPNAVKALSLSPDGALAAVLYEGVVSLVDLKAGTIVHSSITNGSQTMVAVTDSGLLYLLGQTGGQWVNPAITIIDGYTGTQITPAFEPFGVSYGTMNGVYSDVYHKLFVLASGLSPAEIYNINLDPSTGNTTGNGQAPYWGDYPMVAPLYLSDDQSLLFTSAGTYFSTADLTYVGTFNLGVPIQSMSYSSAAQEAVVLPTVNDSGSYSNSPTDYPSAYKRFTGSLLFPAGDVPLPMIGGQQSYGLQIFHNSSGGHVIIVQTGTSQVKGNGALYFLVVR